MESEVIPKVPKDSDELIRLLKQGEGPTLEFKRSTGELREGLQTICAFLNGSGGMVLFGVRPDGNVEGQQVSDQTLREVAQAFERFEPPVNVPIERLSIRSGKELLILRVQGTSDSVPFTFEGRPYERIASATRKMSQERYEALLLERGHARRRWENQLAVDVRLGGLDREEILRTREAAIQQRRILAGTSRNIGDILDRLGLRRDGVITQAAQVLYGTRFLPDYPQCLLKMGRFRGTTITGDILDNKQEYMHAFAMIREGMAFLDRTLPLAARFPEGKLFREDRLPVPPNALREILLNAVMHRDYSHTGGHVAIAVFDDRIEIRSTGRLPSGVTVEQLSGPHRSELRNPLIAGVFHRTGAVEIWGRGTNRVIEECKRYGIASPTFDDWGGSLVVTFRAPIIPEAGAEPTDQVGTKSAPSRHQVGTKSALSEDQVKVMQLCRQEQPLITIMSLVGRSDRTKFRDGFVKPLIEAGLLELTIPDKPQSRLQKYRLTEEGGKALKKKRDSR
jgi:ATP-dependent DNA helicase RecG